MSHPSIQKGEFLHYACLGEVNCFDQYFDEVMGFMKENPGLFCLSNLGVFKKLFEKRISIREFDLVFDRRPGPIIRIFKVR